MSKEYAELSSEIIEVTTEVFNGREFKKIRSAHEPFEEFEIGQIMYGSERSLSGCDEVEGDDVDAVEQYVLKSAGSGRFIASHFLEIAWGNHSEDEYVMVDLDTRELNDVNGKRYTGPAAITMAERVLEFLEVVRPAELYAVPDADLSRLDDYVRDAVTFSEIERDQLGSVRIGFAASSNLVGYVAKRELSGREFREDIFGRIVKRLCRVYGLTETEVDTVIDLRMQEMAAAQLHIFSRKDAE